MFEFEECNNTFDLCNFDLEKSSNYEFASWCQSFGPSNTFSESLVLMQNINLIKTAEIKRIDPNIYNKMDNKGIITKRNMIHILFIYQMVLEKMIDEFSKEIEKIANSESHPQCELQKELDDFINAINLITEKCEEMLRKETDKPPTASQNLAQRNLSSSILPPNEENQSADKINDFDLGNNNLDFMNPIIEIEPINNCNSEYSSDIKSSENSSEGNGINSPKYVPLNQEQKEKLHKYILKYELKETPPKKEIKMLADEFGIKYCRCRHYIINKREEIKKFVYGEALVPSWIKNEHFQRFTELCENYQTYLRESYANNS
ncbi:hypothetical protein TRFO_09230 [Tritrichomonas foetus]|uniref:Uncharacterized protein n=1 Tax=Tritrichomonas foetus TaxID=1144522 RepID=A0A1J4JJW5_9EUKA|nr:hypothetical protein TRFO_09230 [Tritrichomonas foetus]|eukprot:OHS97811.1 hypothetical protein TRFO_09230 [Tritrichomonas foetus]